jgi:hypothetical protein
MEVLRTRVPDTTTAVVLLELQRQQQAQNGTSASPTYSHQFQQIREDDFVSPVSMSVSSHPSQTQAEAALFGESPQARSQARYGVPSLKRKRGDFELNVENGVDVVSKGLINVQDAGVYFRAFFQGCVSHSLSKAVK